MDKKFSKTSWVIVTFCCAAVVALFFNAFSVLEMASNSMEPVVRGRGNPPTRTGDIVLVAKWYRASSLRSGDLVVVNIPTPTGQVRTVRKIDSHPDTPQGKFWLSASGNGIDSRHFGALPASEIYGRVVWVLR